MASAGSVQNSSNSEGRRLLPYDGSVGGASPIDLVHLSRQTLGDRALETELLRLFAGQCEQILAKLEETQGDRQASGDLAHTLKGSARAVGATAVAAAAEKYEVDLSVVPLAEPPSIASLKMAADEAREHIIRLLGES